MRPAVVTALLGLVLALAAATFDAEPLYVPGGRASCCSRVGAVAWVALGARAARRSRARVSARRVVEDEPLARRRSSVRAASLALPAGLHRRPAARRAGSRSAAGRRTARVRDRRALRAPRAQARSAPPQRRRARPARRSRRASSRRRARPTRCSCCRGSSRSSRRRARATATGLAARRGRPSVAAEVDLDGLRPHRARRARLAHLLAGARAQRRARSSAGCAPRATRARSSSSTRAAPRATTTLDAAVRAAASLAVHLARRGGCALLLPGRPAARPSLEPTLAGWPHVHARLALVDAAAAARSSRASPTAAAPVIYVAARRAAAPAAGADARAGRRRASSSSPARSPGRARALHRRGLPRLRAVRPARRRGGGVMAANVVRVGAPGAPPREAPRDRAAAPSPGVARLVGFVPLAMFGALQWGALLHAQGAGPDAARRGRGGRRRRPAARDGARPASRRARRAARSPRARPDRAHRCSSPACRCGCSGRATGTSSLSGLGAGDRVAAGDRRCPTAASTSGCGSR